MSRWSQGPALPDIHKSRVYSEIYHMILTSSKTTTSSTKWPILTSPVSTVTTYKAQSTHRSSHKRFTENRSNITTNYPKVPHGYQSKERATAPHPENRTRIRKKSTKEKAKTETERTSEPSLKIKNYQRQEMTRGKRHKVIAIETIQSTNIGSFTQGICPPASWTAILRLGIARPHQVPNDKEKRKRKRRKSS